MQAWHKPSFPLSPDDVANLVRRSVPASSCKDEAVACDDSASGAVIAIGAFDGVHLGHQKLISAAIEEARRRGLPSIVVTFDPDPSEFLAGSKAERRLLSIADRVALIQALGVDDVMVLPFTSDLAQLSPEGFFDMLGQRIGTMAGVHVGSNFRFGRYGSGSVETLRELGRVRGFEVNAHQLLVVDGMPVSSTRIRGLLAKGEVEEAAALLGRCHYVRGHVRHGRGEGTAFGFPTANVRTDRRGCMPAEGVYACVVSDGVNAWPAAANVGAPPTFDSHRDDSFLEANLLGFEGNLYDRELSVVFVAWLRASRPFSSLEELERVVLGNIDWVRCNIGDSHVEVGP